MRKANLKRFAWSIFS